MSKRIVARASLATTAHRTRGEASTAASVAAPTANRTAFPFADVNPNSSNDPSKSRHPPSARTTGATNASMCRTIGVICTGSTTGRVKDNSASVRAITLSSWLTAASANLLTAVAGTSGFSARERTTSRFTATPLSAPFSSCARDSLMRCNMSSHNASVPAELDDSPTSKNAMRPAPPRCWSQSLSPHRQAPPRPVAASLGSSRCIAGAVRTWPRWTPCSRSPAD